MSTRLYANENPQHFIHEMKTIAYDVMDVNVSPRTLMRLICKKGGSFGAYYTTNVLSLAYQLN